jgi:putrescine:ornithine antiporter
MHGPRSTARRSRVAIAACTVAALAAGLSPHAQERRAAGTVDRIQASSRLRLGYRDDARPFAYKNDAGQAAGYSVALCQQVADDVKGELHLTGLTVEWVPVAFADRFAALQQGRIDLLCGSDTVTLARRKDVAFSIPIFPGGIGALVRADAPARLKDVLAGRGQPFRPTWRAAAGQLLQTRAFSVVAGTTAASWVAERLADLEIVADVTPVASYDAGIRALLDLKSDVLFGERAVLLDAAKRHPSARALTVVDRLFTYEPLALAMDRGDDDFRLLVDRALSRLYRSGAIGALFATAFGEPDENALTFFRWNALPD